MRRRRCARPRDSRPCPLHRLRGTDPNWSFERIVAVERRRGASSVFFVMPATAIRRTGRAGGIRPAAAALVETLLGLGAEIGLHGSYRRAFDPRASPRRSRARGARAARSHGQRYHYLRVDPHRTSRRSRPLGLRYDSSLGFGGRARLPRGHRAPVPPVGLRTRPAARPRRDPARGDGRDARRGALPRPVGEARRSGGCSRCSTGRPSTAAASRSSGTRTASTRRPPAAGTGSTRGCSTESTSAAAPVSRPPNWFRPIRPDRSSAVHGVSAAPGRSAASALHARSRRARS